MNFSEIQFYIADTLSLRKVYLYAGEIFKAYGHYQEAGLHLRHTLELRPDFEPAIAALRDMESVPEATIHMYTLLIIICLVLGVLLVILSSVDAGPAGSGVHETAEYLGQTTLAADGLRPQRHFNRAMAMRSLRGVRSFRQVVKKGP